MASADGRQESVPVGTIDSRVTAFCERYVQEARAAYRTEPYQSYTNSLLKDNRVRYRPDLKGVHPRYAQPAAGTVLWHQVEGTDNFRDIGGWTGLKTGRAYRGAEPNCHTNVAELAKRRKACHNLFVTPKGLDYLSKTLGIRTDLDLRGASESPTPDQTPIPGARLVRCPITAYTNFMSRASRTNIVAALRVFADAKNYPIYFHCYGGADRTGTLAFLLEGLCGVDEADLAVDYELTTYGHERRLRVDGHCHYASLVRMIKERPGRTLSEKIAYVLRHELGLTTDEIAAIQRNLLK